MARECIYSLVIIMSSIIIILITVSFSWSKGGDRNEGRTPQERANIAWAVRDIQHRTRGYIHQQQLYGYIWWSYEM